MPNDDNERKCLLTPQTNSSGSGGDVTKFPFHVSSIEPEEMKADDEGTGEDDADEPIDIDAVQSDGDPGDDVSSVAGTSRPPSSNLEMIYSEPSLHKPNAYPPFAISDTFLPNLHAIKMGGFPSSRQPRGQRLSRDSGAAASISTPKESSVCLSESSIATGTGPPGSARPGHKASFSAREIREQHMTIQNKYRPQRQRHFTDPVDFEGILNIIGGCSWWQIWVYCLIALQQIPHAMFNLNVVYMMYQPDHWCQVPGFGNESTSSDYMWDLEDTLHLPLVFPSVSTNRKDSDAFHDQCYYYDRGIERYQELRRMNISDAMAAIASEKEQQIPRVKCNKWHYKKDVMVTTIVTDWDLVCDHNMMRGHAHLFYCFGYLIGCLIGGFASDSFGRKPTVIGFGLLSSMFGFLLPYTQYFPMFLFIRFCSAVCNEAADLAAYVLCMEITGVKYRAMVGSLLQAPWAVGYALLALLAYFAKSWKTIQMVAALLHFIAVLIICILPESPRWLMVIDRLGEAEKVIREACRPPPFPFSLCRKNHAPSLPADLELVQHRETSKWARENRKASLSTMFKSFVLRERTAIICTVFVATALVYYGVVIALSDQSAPGRVLFSGNFFFNNAIAGAIELPTLIACVYLMKFGRRRAQMITLNSAAVCILCAVVAVLYKRYMIALVFLLLGKIFVQGAFNILYIFCSELYPTVIRNTAVGFNSMIARAGSGVSSYIAILSDVTLPIVPMCIFAVFSFFAGALVRLLPETRDKPLPETIEDAVTVLQPEENELTCCGFSLSALRRRRGTAEATTAEWSYLADAAVATEEAAAKEDAVIGSEEPSSIDTKDQLPSERQSAIESMLGDPDAPVKDRSISRERPATNSLAADIAGISIPDKLSEPFDE